MQGADEFSEIIARLSNVDVRSQVPECFLALSDLEREALKITFSLKHQTTLLGIENQDESLSDGREDEGGLVSVRYLFDNKLDRLEYEKYTLEQLVMMIALARLQNVPPNKKSNSTSNLFQLKTTSRDASPRIRRYPDGRCYLDVMHTTWHAHFDDLPGNIRNYFLSNGAANLSPFSPRRGPRTPRQSNELELVSSAQSSKLNN